MNKKNKKLFMIIIGIALIAVLLIGGSYAWLNYQTNNITVAGGTECFDINYSTGGNISGTIGGFDERLFLTNDSITINNSMALSSISIGLDSRCNKFNGLGTIELNVSSLADSFKKNGDNEYALKYIIADYNPAVDGEATINNLNGKTFNFIKKGSIFETGTIDIYSEYLVPGEQHNYLIIIYINNELLSSSILGNVVSASVTARGEEFVPTPLSDFEYYTGSYASPSGTVTIPDDKVLLVKYNGTGTTVNVPSKYTINGNEYTSTLYAYQGYTASTYTSTFSGNTNIEHVNFADDVVFSSNNAKVSSLRYDTLLFTFLDCTSLTDVTNLPNDNITRLNMTFRNCTSLVNISNIPSNITLASYTFHNCTSLIDAPVIPDSVNSMPATFLGCTSLVNVPVIPELVTNLEATFYQCSSLRGTILINSSIVTSTMNSTFNTTASNQIVVDVPRDSDTYNTIMAKGVGNAIIVTH